MVNYYASLNNGGRGFTLTLSISPGTGNVGTNSTPVSWSLTLTKGTNSYSSWTKYWSVNIGGVPYSGSIPSYDFRGYSSLTLASDTTTITHDSNGTKTIGVSGSFDEAGHVLIGNGTASGSVTLTPIPRATTPTVSPTSGNTASPFTITHIPAVSSFYHDIAYSINAGASYTDIVVDLVGTDTSTNWTPPHTLFPNATGGTARVRVITKNASGGSVIGS